MEFVAWFEQIGKDSGSTAGGKGANLGELVKIRMPVPPGFVITTKAFDKFIELNGIKNQIQELVDSCDVDNTDEVVQISKQIKGLIISQDYPIGMKTELIDGYREISFTDQIITPKAMELISAGRDYALVAVRSSATTEDLPTASFAGQQATFLNVKGIKEYLESVKKCWASLYEPRAIFYRAKYGFKHASIAVVVQRMVSSDSSGVIFTINPTSNENEIIIESTWGLGETLVLGEIEPDSYRVSKDGRILEKKIGKKDKMRVRDLATDRTVTLPVAERKVNAQVISDQEILRLSEYALAIEKHYQKPQDIEFAIERGRIFIVQTRSITTEAKKEEIEVEGEVLVKGLGSSPGIAAGTVKIVHGLEDLAKIQKGDVLVTEMTSPDMVLAMSRSVAIVTNSGGATCIGGDGKILTNEGFMTLKELYPLIKSGKTFHTISLDVESMKIIWKRILDIQKRVSDAFVVKFYLQSNDKYNNDLVITNDHKMLIFNNRQLSQLPMGDLLSRKESALSITNIPPFNFQISNESMDSLWYLAGAILSDGCVAYRNGRPVGFRFTQKNEGLRGNFIEFVKSQFSDVFDINLMDTSGHQMPAGGFAARVDEYSSNRKLPALVFDAIKKNLAVDMIHLIPHDVTKFLAGLIDGDGHFNKEKSWIEIYIDEDDLPTLEGCIIACLRIGISPRVRKRKSMYELILPNSEKISQILRLTKRVRGNVSRRFKDIKMLSANQLIGDIWQNIDWRGSLWTYVKKNRLIGINKLVSYLKGRIDENLLQELERIKNSDLCAYKAKMVKSLKEQEVYNLTIESKDEIGHNFVVFTSLYTPIVVKNCHASIVGREMGLPVIVGTQNATQVLQDGQVVTVDAYKGVVYAGALEIKRPIEVIEEAPSGFSTVTQIKANVAFPENVEQIASKADGVGLLRIEHMITKSGIHPAKLIRENRTEEYIKILLDGIRPIAKAFHPKPVWVRTLDARSDEFRNLEGGAEEPKEDNPMLGWHGIRRSLDEPKLLKAEFEAIKRLHEEGLNNVHVMLPFVISVDELRRAREIAKEAELPPDCKIGVMVETPAAAMIIEDLCKEGIDFISFGSNDLSQLVLGVDRNNAKIASLFTETHPAVKKLIKYVIKVCKSYNVESSICGEAPNNIPEFVEFLVKCGIDSISLNMDAIDRVRNQVMKIERRILVEAMKKGR